MTKYLSINLEVSEALKNKTPIVALESTIISHGMPYPQNVQTALQAQQIIREHGATPATIAIINGFLKIGLTEKEIDYLGRKGTDVLKTSSRDIPYIVSKKLDGATTVSATAFIASLAGIRVFATGGIGGVHRGAETSFDISADLEELAKTNVAVVCAGAKSILDLGLTLEYLETKAIEVIGYQTDFLPAFYTSKSEFKVNHRLDSALEIAQLMQAKWEMGLRGGIIVANPIPKEYEVDPIIIDKAIEIAIKEMNELHITGNKTTPYLLAKIKEITGGASLDANIQLVYNNCKLASNIAQNLY
ncbi:MAG: pseudouridine-5'-phosphate glycosidase [Bacilli bacterium]|jgi:pseudouridine-5'-phosphate glycosidase|nr:pseudouridine-5'-phosphate glycosidase [Bacilli bacterium]MDD4056731.1 pseudouridine-5'-phosphate glycosidase [Bacilli bacterium]